MTSLLKGKKFLMILSAFALSVVLIFIFLIKPEENKYEIRNVDFTKNVLMNSQFEEISISPWEVDFSQKNQSYAYLDDIVKFKGKNSLCLLSESKNNLISVSQTISNVQRNKKYILNGYLKTEDFVTGFLKLELYSASDSLIAFSDSYKLKGMNDWTFLTTWVRTMDTKITKIKVKLVLEGNGRVWFDELELFPVEINTIFLTPSN